MEITSKKKCCLYIIISIRFFSITICNLLIDLPTYFAPSAYNKANVRMFLVKLFIRGSARKLWATSHSWQTPQHQTNEYFFGRWHQLLSYLRVRYGVSHPHHVTVTKRYKMADNVVSFRQRAVIEFLVTEEIPAADIHHRLQCVCREMCAWALLRGAFKF